MSYTLEKILRDKNETARELDRLYKAKEQLGKLSGKVCIEELKGYGHRVYLPVVVVRQALAATIDETEAKAEKYQTKIDIMEKALKQAGEEPA